MKLYQFWHIALLLLLAACTTVVPKTPQEAINEANIYLNATAQQIGENVKNGVMTKAEAQDALDKVKTYRDQVDIAQTLLDQGNAAAAMDKAKIVRSLVIALHREVAKRAREVK